MRRFFDNRPEKGFGYEETKECFERSESILCEVITLKSATCSKRMTLEKRVFSKSSSFNVERINC